VKNFREGESRSKSGEASRRVSPKVGGIIQEAKRSIKGTGKRERLMFQGRSSGKKRG